MPGQQLLNQNNLKKMELPYKINFANEFSKREITGFISVPVKTVLEDTDDPTGDRITAECPPEEAEAYGVYANVLEDCCTYREWIADVESAAEANRLKGLLYDLAGLQRPYVLTAKILMDMTPGTLIGTGVILDQRLHNGCVRWAAKRGDGFHDWALYYHHSTETVDYVLRYGDKSTTEAVIRRLVPCDDEAFALYRK
jgi:hypothetical protein